MKYSDDIIQRVRDASDIVSVVGEYVPLKKAGSSYKGLCPFHSEKSPSFIVSPSRHSFHCFGCGKGGNVITFVMEMEKMPFPEALRHLAAKAGVPLPTPQDSARDVEADRRRERMLALNELAGKLYHEKLLSPEGQGARDYYKARGFTREMAVKFQIGFAPPGWDFLKNAAQKAGFTQEELLAAGLVVHNEEKNTYYDKFRNRLIFPVFNNYDKIIAFGGRTLGEDAGPKYLNSPETLLFKKGETLYLLNAARDGIRRVGFVLVVEGYFDALALHLHGFDNTVATLGTALTAQHGPLVKRYTKDVVFSYDADAAGQAAVLRGFEPLMQAGLNVKVLVLPDAKDPDEYLQKHPKEELAGLIEKAPDFFRWWAASLAKKMPDARKEDLIRELETFVPVLAQLGDEVSVQAACAAIESELSLDNRDLLTLVNIDRKKGGARRMAPGGSAAPNAPVVSSKPKGDGSEEIESDFLALLTEERGEFVPWAANELSPQYFGNEKFRNLFEKISAGEMKPAELNSVPELEPSFLRMEARAEKRKQDAALWNNKTADEVDQKERQIREAMILEFAGEIKKRYVKRQMDDLRQKQGEAEKAGNVEEALLFARQMGELKKQFS
ncbi:MAG: DNA primase [bacterium]